ncbi:N-acylneuraminate cytidylyltransferase, partial [Hyposmocoma kahamanoa]|uniref:N-acylneuraminate cytidylyltransferase n=1 Tax=Hyposmocoma kahamanoa TaxID=1477025 RepID=UPI000E6D7F9E
IIIFTISSNGETAILILARGGSKGVRLKNLQTVGRVTLLTRAIHLAKLTGIEDVTVSTDHPAIALEAIKSGAAVFRRSKVTASDRAPSIWGAAEFLYSRTEIHILALIQATSPFTRANYLRAALEKIRRPRAFDCVFSVTRSHKLRWKEINGTLSAINFDVSSRPRRQDWSGELLETGAFYIARRQLIETGHFQNDNCTVFEIPTEDSLEVDSYYDLRVAGVLLNSNLRKNRVQILPQGGRNSSASPQSMLPLGGRTKVHTEKVQATLSKPGRFFGVVMSDMGLE